MRKAGFFLILVFVVLVVVFCFKVSKISSIECVSQFTKCNGNTLASIEKVEKSSIVATKINLKKALSDDPLVKKYSLQLKLNGKYIVLIEERIPKYCLKSNNENYFFDSDSVLIKINGGENIKCIEESGISYKLRDRLNNKDSFLQNVFYNMRNISDLGRAYVENENLIVEYKGKTKLIFPTEGDAEVLAGKAYYTVSQFDKIEKYIIDIGNLSVSEIDFRYKDPVVRFI
jgi:hypothetical protein